jgi:hypothetical protein
MLTHRWRPVVYAAVALVVLWVLAMAGYLIARNARVTSEKVVAYAQAIDLSRLQGEARANAIRKLADMLNKLSVEERRKARLDRSAFRWMEQMTEAEKGEIIEATLPTGFKQMLTAFEQLPEEKRRKAVDDAVRRLRDAQIRMQGGDPRVDTNGPPPLSPELQARIRTIGLKAFYSQSSAETKAELAPVLEELQRNMESGRITRRR